MKISPLEHYQESHPKSIFTSKDKSYSIHFLEIIEPNNGRVLQKLKIYNGKRDITKEFYGDWNYTNFLELPKYDFFSADGNFVFLPGEQKLIIYNTKEKSQFVVYRLQNLKLSYCDNQSLFIISLNKLIIVNLGTNNFKTIDIKVPFDLAFFRGEKLFILSLTQGLYRYSFSNNELELLEQIILPDKIFANELYQQYEELASHRDKKNVYGIGIKTDNLLYDNDHINQWKLVKWDNVGNSIILGTNVPVSMEKVNNSYSFNYWFHCNAMFAHLELSQLLES